MGIENIFNIGSSGILVNRLAIEVTSENIANVNTPGYSRQRTIMETGPNTPSNGFMMGSGVRMAAVQRSYDGLLQLQLVRGESSYNQSLARQNALNQLEPLFNELTNNGLGDAMQQFFNSWQDLSINPQGIPERQAVLTRAQVMVDNFQQISRGLEDTRWTTNATVGGIVSEITEQAGSIALLNSEIVQAELSGANANELRDQRDLMLRQIAEKVGVNYFEEQDGSVSVYLPGGQELVRGFQYRGVYASSEYPSKIMLTNALGDPPSAANPTVDIDVTATIGGTNNSKGAIGGTLLVRDSIIPGYQGTLNELAYNLVNEVNTMHQAGYGLSLGSTGINFFSAPIVSNQNIDTSGTGNTLSGVDTTQIIVGMVVTGTPGIPSSPPTTVIATPQTDPRLQPGTVRLSSALDGTGAAGTAVVFAGVDATGMSINASLTLNDIAASSSNPASGTGGPGNNENALAIAGLWQNGSIDFTIGSSSLAGFYNTFTSAVGVNLQSVNNEVAQGEGFLRQLETLRESNSGVSLDEELTNLMKYQRAFQGSSKVLTTATEMLDTILNLVR